MKNTKFKGFLPAVIVIIVVALVTFGLIRRCNTDDSTLADDYSRPGDDTLSVAIEMSRLTYSMHNDTAEGFDYQILTDIGHIHKIPVSFHPINDLEAAFRGLDEGEYDIVVASVPATNRLKEFFSTTDPIYIDRQVLVQQRDTSGIVKIASPEQLRNDSVWIAEGSPARTRLVNMARELGDSIYIFSEPGYSAEHLAIMTALGELPRAVVSESIAKHVAADYPNLDISVPMSFNQFQVWTVAPRDSVLRDSINSWLESYKASPAFRELKEKYL